MNIWISYNEMRGRRKNIERTSHIMKKYQLFNITKLHDSFEISFKHTLPQTNPS